jgi:hypothetical protein
MKFPSQTAKTDQTQVCTRCVMDTSAPAIVFDQDGVCNYCHAADRDLKRIQLSKEESERELASATAEIVSKRTKSGYDSVIG